MTAEQQLQAQDDAGVLQADAQIVAQEAESSPSVTAQEVGAETVAQDDAPDTVADAPVVAADAAQPDAPAPVKPLSESAQTVLAWIRSMAAVAPHQTQLTFETFLAQNIASLDEFDAALGD